MTWKINENETVEHSEFLFLSLSSSEACTSRDNFLIVFCLQTFMNCGLARWSTYLITEVKQQWPTFVLGFLNFLYYMPSLSLEENKHYKIILELRIRLI